MKTGNKIDNFTLGCTGIGQFELQEQLDQLLVIFIYPKDNTPGCTIEAQEFSALKERFHEAGAKVFGISKDNIKSHENFKSKHDLQLELISDPECKVIKALDAWKEKSLYGKKFMGVERSTVIIDQNMSIMHSWQKVTAKGHAKQVLDYILKHKSS